MIREQLIDYLESVLSPSGRAVTVADFNLIPDILSALRGPQPDPETGLLPCGCGGKAILFHQPDIEGPGSDGDRWAVFCEKTCGMQTSDMTSPEYAVETWNTAMSGGMCNHEN